MSSPAFDTHKAVKTLTDAGATGDVAEAVVTIGAAISERMVTKDEFRSGIKGLRSEFQSEFKDVRSEIKDLRVEMRSEFKNVRSEMLLLKRDMTIRLGGMIVTAVAVVTAFDKLL